MSKLTVHLVPSASISEVVGRSGDGWKMRIAAPPVDGKANEALIELLSDVLDVPKSSIQIVKGHTAKTKVLDIPLSSGDIEDLLSKASRP